MKRIVAVVLSMLMVMVMTAAFAAEKEIVFTDPLTGASVYLEMEGEHYLEFLENPEEDMCIFEVSRDGFPTVTVTVYAKDTTDKNMNDWTDEEMAQCIAFYQSEESEGTLITEEVTPAGNKYIRFLNESEEGSVEERYTVFEDFDMSRIMFKEGGTFTEEETAFLAEVQSSLWVMKAE